MMSKSDVYYHNNVMSPKLLQKVTQEVLNIDWCIPPAGIPGNHPPRYVAALGDGSNISSKNNKIFYSYPRNFPKTTSYPLFQCAKNSSAHYKMKKIPKNLCYLIKIIRNLVQQSYNNTAINVNDMFNVCVCNFYTEDNHQISDHRDDERWLQYNELDANGQPFASIIASLTIYPEDIPNVLRKFQIYDDNIQKWITNDLEHNSILLFSNHRHRAPKVTKGNSCKRINITFRTLAPGLLGLVGYGNFYRYMSIPYKISCVNTKHIDQSQQFIQSAINSNNFNNRFAYDPNIPIIEEDEEERKLLKARKKEGKEQYLPKYVKSLCTVENYTNFET